MFACTHLLFFLWKQSTAEQWEPLLRFILWGPKPSVLNLMSIHPIGIYQSSTFYPFHPFCVLFSSLNKLWCPSVCCTLGVKLLSSRTVCQLISLSPCSHSKSVFSPQRKTQNRKMTEAAFKTFKVSSSPAVNMFYFPNLTFTLWHLCQSAQGLQTDGAW